MSKREGRGGRGDRDSSEDRAHTEVKTTEII